ncbi:MAG TPA: hypothetical protein PLD10_09365 [Rhodopila sp.]|nr:hypothetical protein [Rhodopila sp.]
MLTKRVSQVRVCLKAFGVGLDRPAIISDCVLGLSLVLQDIAKAVIRVRIVGLQADGAMQACNRLILLTLLPVGQAEVEMGFRRRAVEFERLPVAGNGFANVPGLMMLKRFDE